MILETLVVGPLEVNCYILGCEETREGIVIDPGDDVPDILDVLRRRGIRVKYIANTHAHFDHVGGVKGLKEVTGAQFLLHRDDLFLLNSMAEQASLFGFDAGIAPKVERFLVDGDKVAFGEETLKVLHTPGHSPGGVCYYTDDKAFVGDTLFAGSIGRTDLAGGSYQALIDSVKNRLFSLDDDVMVYPGHGPVTTIGGERLHNPFFNQDWML